jgi:hypothetical protein
LAQATPRNNQDFIGNVFANSFDYDNTNFAGAAGEANNWSLIGKRVKISDTSIDFETNVGVHVHPTDTGVEQMQRTGPNVSCRCQQRCCNIPWISLLRDLKLQFATTTVIKQYAAKSATITAILQ